MNTENNLDHEKRLIGACLNDQSIEDALNCGVLPHMFQHPAAIDAWKIFMSLREQKLPLDLPTVGSRVSEPGHCVWLAESMFDASIVKSSYWADEVVSAHWVRSLTEDTNRIVQETLRRRPFESTETLCASIVALHKKFLESTKSSVQSRSMKTIVDDLLEDLDSGTHASVPSGFKSIDQRYGGFMPPDLWIVAARPSMGKTTFAVNCAANAAAAGKNPVYFTAEMRDTQIVLKEISRISKIPLTKIRRLDMDTHEMDRFKSAAESVCDMTWSVNYAASRSIQSIENETRRLHRQKKCDIVFVDYLQLVHADGRWDSKHSEITYITGRLKSIAIDLNIPVVACAQVNRELDKTGKKPNWRGLLTMLKDSGSIEQDADVVMFIEGEEKAPEIDLIFAKVRFGERGKTRCASNLEINSFSDAAYRMEEKP